MLDARTYSATELLRDGQRIEIRALKPEDRPDLITAAGRASPQSLYRRFFGFKRAFTEQEIAYYAEVDHTSHVALIAVVGAGGQSRIVGGGRYIVVRPGQAELAFVVVDEYQGRGVGARLLHHLVVLARGAGLRELAADVLAENAPMLRVFERSGLPHSSRSEGRDVVHITLRLS
jgi:RimJ/RimL family protein N-acetyltransferase